MYRKTVVLLLTALVLASCKKDDTQTTTTAPVASAVEAVPNTAPKQVTSAPEWDTSSAPVPGTALTLAPNPLNLCTEKNASAEVVWDMTAANPKALQLWIRSNGKSKLWAAVKIASGKKRTGKWLKAGTEIVAVDASSKKVINSVQATAAACQ